MCICCVYTLFHRRLSFFFFVSLSLLDCNILRLKSRRTRQWKHAMKTWGGWGLKDEQWILPRNNKKRIVDMATRVHDEKNGIEYPRTSQTELHACVPFRCAGQRWMSIWILFSSSSLHGSQIHTPHNNTTDFLTFDTNLIFDIMLISFFTSLCASYVCLYVYGFFLDDSHVAFVFAHFPRHLWLTCI